MGRPKMAYEKVAEFFRINGYTLVSKEYKKNEAKLKSLCPNGHIYEVSWNHFKQGTRCNKCNLDSRKEPLSVVAELAKKDGYILISTVYEESQDKLHFICDNGHNCFIKHYKFKQGQRCGTCYGNYRKNIEEVRTFLEKERYELISSEYENCTDTELSIRCPKGHEYPSNYNNFQQGRRCPTCKKAGTSKPEQELFGILKEFFPRLIKKNFSVDIPGKPYIHRFQVDILDPETKLGIEYDGSYHHSEKYLIETKTKLGWPIGDAIDYHPIKDGALWDCHSVKLLHIKGKDWENDKQACISRCLEFLGAKNG